MILVPHQNNTGSESKIQHLSPACVLHVYHTGDYLRFHDPKSVNLGPPTRVKQPANIFSQIKV